MPKALPATGNTTHTKPENRAFYPALDGIRAIAILMVFFWHYMALPWGWAGVNVFFVLSGFLITGILYDTRDDEHRVRNFYVRRTLRIFPLYYGVFAALVLTLPIAHWQITWKWIAWPAYLANFALFLHPTSSGSPLAMLAYGAVKPERPGMFALHIGHFWTLCVEEQFYLVWPWIVFWLRDRRKLLWICGLSVPLCLMARVIGSHCLPQWMLDREILSHATFFRMDDLLLGGFLALLLRGPHQASVLRAARMLMPIAFAAVLVWFFLTPYHHFTRVGYGYPENVLTLGFTAISTLSGLLIAVAIQPGTVVQRALSLRPLRWLGRISYGAYVLHDIFHAQYSAHFNGLLMRVANRSPALRPLILDHKGFLISLLALAATILLASLSFRFYESPFLNLKERWTLRRNT